MRLIFSGFAVFFFFLTLNMGNIQAQVVDTPSDLDRANKLFESEKYSEALPIYEQLYAEGIYTERMLYRLSYMHETLKNYPDAIFYLKKIRQEYGGAAVENKVKQLLQANGATKFYSASGWDSYIQFFADYGFLIWGLTLISALWLVFHFVTARSGLPSWRKLAFAIALLPFIAGSTLLVLRGYVLPDRAVMVGKTAFYSFPSYAANHSATALPMGETVNITGKEDIWLEVKVGEEVYWVPEWSVRRL